MCVRMELGAGKTQKSKIGVSGRGRDGMPARSFRKGEYTNPVRLDESSKKALPETSKEGETEFQLYHVLDL